MKTLNKIPIALIFLLFTFLSCQDEKNTITLKKESVESVPSTEYSMSLNRIDFDHRATIHHGCPNSGQNCAPKPSLTDVDINVINEFEEHIEDGPIGVKEFFTNGSWQELAYNLEDEYPIIYNKLISGTYEIVKNLDSDYDLRYSIGEYPNVSNDITNAEFVIYY
jgi:hypothetical protein